MFTLQSIQHCSTKRNVYCPISAQRSFGTDACLKSSQVHNPLEPDTASHVNPSVGFFILREVKFTNSCDNRLSESPDSQD
jgi:hypothetical protein